MKEFLKAIFCGLAVALLRRYRQLSLDLLRIEAAALYLRGVSAARKAFLGGVLLALCLMLAGIGFVLFHIGLFLLLPRPWNAIVFMILGATYVIAMLLVFRRLCSEKTWLEFSRAGEYADAAARKTRH